MKVVINISIYLLAFVMGINSYSVAQEITLSPQSLYFGQIPNGKDAYREIVVRETGGSSLNISQISVQGSNSADFSIVDNPGSLNLNAYGRTTLTLNFHPKSVGEKQAEIVFVSNASSSPDNISIMAAGTRVSSGKITFERIIGTLEGDGASDVRATTDGGFIICGNTYNVDEEFNDGYLVKTNAYGEIEWTESYDSDDNDDNGDRFSSVIPVADGYIAVGNTDNGSRDLDLWIVKTNLMGVMQWQKLFGDTDNDEANEIASTSDGNFIIIGSTIDPDGVTLRDGYLLKIDGSGTEIWSRIIGGNNSENFASIKEIIDEGYIIAGNISQGAGADMLLIKTNLDGQVVWQHQYGEAGDQNIERANSVAIAADNGYILAGSTSSIGAGAIDIFVIKTNASGVKDETWGDKTFGDEHRDGASNVIRTIDGGYLLVGSIENLYKPLPINDWFSDAYIIKLDQNGNFVWEKVFGGDWGESISSVRELSDGSFVLCGGTSSYGSNGDSNIYLLRISNNGEIITSVRRNVFSVPDNIYLNQNYPNPFNNRTTISYNLINNTEVNLKIYDLSGRLVDTIINQVQQKGSYTISYNAAGLASGVYLYRLTTPGFTSTKKLILIK